LLCFEEHGPQIALPFSRGVPPWRDEIIVTITDLAFYAGWPPAMTARQIARKAFEESGK
jgi:hypothetical protein